MVNPVLNAAPQPAQSAKQTQAQGGEGFGAVLAKQMGDNTAPAIEKNKVENSKLEKTDKADAAANDQKNLDQAQALPAIDATNLAALLLGNPTVKSAVTPDAKNTKDQPAAAPDTMNVAALINPEIKPVTTVITEANTPAEKPNINLLSDKLRRPAESTQSQESVKLPTVTPAKADPAIAVNADKAVFSVAEPAVSQPSPATQAQSASTLIAAGLPPGLPPGLTPVQTNTQNRIAAPLGSTAWPDEFTQKVSWVSTQQSQVAELHLNPPDLGPISVVLSVSDNQATALFTSPHSAVREAIESAMPRLRESLAETGITLGNTTVSDQPPRDSGTGGFMNQRPTPRADGRLTETPQPGLPGMPTGRHNGMVDTFA